MIEEIEKAFRHFVENIYDTLEVSEYKTDLRFYVSRFKKNGLGNGTGSLGLNKAIEVLDRFGYEATLAEYPTVDEAILFFKKNQKRNQMDSSKLEDLSNDELKALAAEKLKKIEALKKEKGID